MSQDINYLNIDPKYSQTKDNDWLRKVKRIPYKILLEDHWFTRRLYQILPRHIFSPLIYELYIAIQTIGSRRLIKRYSQSKDLLINIGAGEHGKSGWVNADVGHWPGLNCIYDCRKTLPFPDGSAKGIFTEHFFEHIDYKEEVPYFLAECYRVLKVGGVIRIIVPDGGKYIEAYCQEGWDELTKMRQLTPEHRDIYFGEKYNTKMELINAIFRQGCEHKYAYDYTTLEFLLYKAGFSTVKRQEFGKSIREELCIDLPSRASESIYVEAIKSSV